MFRLVRDASRDIALCVLDSCTTKAKIGRDPKTCTVQLGTKAVAVSREHADLQWSSSGVTIVDTSSFGTFVDGVKIIKSSKLLKGGERLKIGQEEFIMEKVEESTKTSNTIPPAQNKQNSNKSIASYFTKKNALLRDDSDPAEVSIRKILATETPSESQESLKTGVQSQSTSLRKPVRGPRRVNPLFDLDDKDEQIVDNSKGNVLAVETPSDSVSSQRVSLPIDPTPTRVPITAAKVNTTVEKKKKVSLFAKPNQRPKAQKPILLDDDDIVEIGEVVPPTTEVATAQSVDVFVRPSVPRTRSRINTHGSSVAGSSTGGIGRGKDIESMNNSDDIMEVNPSSILTQVIPSTRKPIVQREKDTADNVKQPPRKKTKSLFAEHYKQQKKLENSKPREKSLLDEDDNGVLNIRYDYCPPKPVMEERAYSCIENLRIMDQMGREAKARLEERCGWNNEVESQYPSVEELTSILCSSYSEEQKKGEGEKEEEGGVERVGHETLDEETKSQLVKFSDSLIVSQPSFDSMASVNQSQTKGFKKFKKAKQGRFASQSAVYSGIIGGSDLVDFREIQM